jgi:RNA polymerase sigma-70 factor, ECF subfamily
VTREDFGRIYDDHYPRVFRYLLWRMGDKNAAEQRTGEVFGVALSAFRRGEEPERVGRWLIGIADDLAGRSQRREPRDPRDPRPAFAVVGRLDEVAMGQLEGAGIWCCMDTLDPAHRRVLLLKIIAGLTTRDVAELIGTTEEAVLSLQLRALQSLQESWKEATNAADRHPAGAR